MTTLKIVKLPQNSEAKKYSNTKFGFSVQKQIYQSFGGTKEYDYKVWRKFGDKVGWRQGRRWLEYGELTQDLRNGTNCSGNILKNTKLCSIYSGTA